MGVEPLRAGAQRNLGPGPQRAIGAPSGDAAGPTETRARSLSYPRILLQSPYYFPPWALPGQQMIHRPRSAAQTSPRRNRHLTRV